MTRFSPCLSRKRQSWERGLRLRFPVPPAWREKGNHGNMAGVLAMAFPPCLSSKRLFHGSHGRPWESSAGVLAMAFSSACRRKGNNRSHGGPLDSSAGIGGSARDGLSPLPVKEKAVSWTWCALAGGFPRRPRRPPEVPGELSMPKHAIIVNKCSTKVVVFGTGSKLIFPG